MRIAAFPLEFESNQAYNEVLGEWLAFASGDRLVADAEADDSLTRWANSAYRRGFSANKGEKLLRALMRKVPEFGRFGNRHVPRCHRALEGWRRRTPPRSRDPHAFPIWATLIWEFCRAGEWLMAIYILVMVVCYFRPSEPLGIQRRDVQPPAHGTTNRWTVLLFPEARPERSKTYAANDSVELYCPWLTPAQDIGNALPHSNPPDGLKIRI